MTYSLSADPPHVVVTGLTVKVAASPALIDARFQSNVTSISENRPAEAALVITNQREATIKVDELQVSSPTAVNVTIDCPGSHQMATAAGRTRTFAVCSFSIPPRTQNVLHVLLETTDSVVPGPRTVVVRVKASDPDSGASASVVAAISFTLDVFAEADILKAVGVPIFLLIPGVIIIVTLWGMLRLWSPWKATVGTNTPSIATAASFGAVLAVFISLWVAVLYPHMTLSLWPHQRRDYLQAYGFRDFYYVFGYSFAIAIIGWLLASAAYPLLRWLVVLTPDDEPADVLRKLTIRRLFRNSQRHRDSVIGGAKGLEVSGLAGTWVVPTVNIVFHNQPGPKVAAEIETRAAGGKTLRLWLSVRQAVKKKLAVLAFRPGDVPAPTLVTNPTKIAPTSQLGAVVEIAPR